MSEIIDKFKKCNKGLGSFEDNVGSLRNAADYLEV